MKLATWNVNSIRSRLDRLLAWLGTHHVMCLQKLKVGDDAFPFEPLREAGYTAAVHGQRAYNGVAILSREALSEVEPSLKDETEDPQARLLSARVKSVRVLSVYVPNGASVGWESWSYKLEWLKRLRSYLDRHCSKASPLVLAGDFNIAPDARARQGIGIGRRLSREAPGGARLLLVGLSAARFSEKSGAPHRSHLRYRASREKMCVGRNR